MIYILLSIISSALLFITFKYMERYNVNVFNCIIINYITSSILGFSLNNVPLHSVTNNHSLILFALIMGIIFITIFYLISLSIQKSGITATIISCKMSVIIPIAFSIIFYKEDIFLLKVFGLILAILAVIFSVIKKKDASLDVRFVYLPIIIFFGTGISDSLIKYTQQEFVTVDMFPIFSTILYCISAITGIIVLIVKKESLMNLLNKKTLLWGISLGVISFGTFYFFVVALNDSVYDSSVIFGINSIGIVLLSIFFALVIFKERLSLINWIGIILSVMSIIILTHFGT